MTSCQHKIIEDSLPSWDAKYVLLIRGHGTQPTLLRVPFDFLERKDQADGTKTHSKTKTPIKYDREAMSHVLIVRTIAVCLCESKCNHITFCAYKQKVIRLHV